MRIVLSTTPIRPVPTNYPPFGSMALITALEKAGYDPIFYDIDGKRPAFEEVVGFYRERKPDLVAISAVVSTAYAYTKRLCLAIREFLPGATIVVGGNLAASAEILHRRAGVDVCAAGEGERVIVNLARHLERHGGRIDRTDLRNVPGVTFLDDNGEMVFTGYEAPLAADEFDDPDFTLLEKHSRIENYITDPLTQPDFARDPRSYEPRRRGKKMAIALSSKGCVARCTFCHRWDKGYRHFPVEAIRRRVVHLQERYDVGFVNFSDENFGSDRKKLDELVEALRPLDVLYQVGGVRCRSVDPDLLRRMKESGCVSMYYGMETGSEKILRIMEKNTTREQNLRAARWTHEAGLYTIYQLVLGMPGEDRGTIDETIDFVNRITEFLPEAPHKRLSINYIQALPGTPVYECARERGLLGRTLADEEAYLLRVSDIDASDDSKFLNFTSAPALEVKSWRHRILFEAERNWRRAHGWNPPRAALPRGAAARERDYYTEGGYFNLKKVVHHDAFYRWFWFLRPVYLASYVVLKELTRGKGAAFARNLAEYLGSFFRPRAGFTEDRSLRRTMAETAAPDTTPSAVAMRPLRLGR